MFFNNLKAFSLGIDFNLLLLILIILVPVLLCVAFLTLAERQVMASIQRRIGPNVSGFVGILQPFFDGLKLGVKEPVLPELSSSGAFSAAPMISFILSQISYCGIFISDSAFQGLILMALSSLGVYGVMLAGWASNSKYAFLGCLRSVALMVSYELGFGAVLLSISLFLTDSTGMKSLNFGDASPFIQFALLPLCLIFFICILAETKRIPFDLPEAEAELVAGYNVEYSSLGFALFFIAEYANMAVMSALASIYFLGGFSAIKLTLIIFAFIWVRGTLPRYRYDSFMRLGWKALLPLSLSLYALYACFDFVF
jgi:NADH:ubiquinone oxidoreductase subunit H